MLTPETVLQGRYRIIRQLGQGGMGAVYEAVDQRLDTTVALKETLFTDERLRRQFEREGRLLARLHHPALPRVSDHFAEDDGQFLVMQFIPGDDLSEMMARKRGPFPADQVLAWSDQLLDALDYLHTQDPQIIHRDIKPQNLKLTSRGQIILLDFGLAKGQAGEISRVTTNASIFGYTPNYAPLEQIQGLGTDPRSDLYSLGATIYHLMTGVKPPDALTRAAALVNGQPDPLKPANEANPAVAPEFDSVLRKAMAQNREQRYATAVEMRQALHATEPAATLVNRGEAQTVLFPPAATTVATPTQTVVGQETLMTGETTVVRPSRRRMMPWALSAVALLVLASGVLGFFLLQKRNDMAQVAPENPAPVASPSAVTPTVTPSEETEKADPRPEAETAQTAPVAKKAEKPTRKDEAKKTQNFDPPQVEVEVQGHDEQTQADPATPNPPDVRVPRLPRRGTTRVMPGGMTVQTFPDGSSLVTMRDGTRVFVDKDGKRHVLGPAIRKQRSPSPAPSP